VFGGVTRTSTGLFGGVCIDNITIPVSGGVLGQQFTVVLLEDDTNATLVYNGTAMPQEIKITGVCRSVRYIVVVSDYDMMCGVSLTVADAAFGSGGGDLGPPAFPRCSGTLGSFGSAGLTPRHKNSKAPDVMGIVPMAVGGLVLLIALVAVVVVAVGKTRARKSAEEAEQNEKGG
jgi:hypothetical protein